MVLFVGSRSLNRFDSLDPFIFGCYQPDSAVALALGESEVEPARILLSKASNHLVSTRNEVAD